MYNIAYRWVWNREDALDLVHDAFIQLSSYRDIQSIEHPKHFLYRILQNLCHNKVRSRRIWRFITWNDDVLVDSGQVEELETEEVSKALRRCVDKLSPKLKKTLLMHYYSEMSYEEISKVLEIPVGTVSSRLNQALQILKKSSR